MVGESGGGSCRSLLGYGRFVWRELVRVEGVDDVLDGGRVKRCDGHFSSKATCGCGIVITVGCALGGGGSACVKGNGIVVKVVGVISSKNVIDVQCACAKCRWGSDS